MLLTLGGEFRMQDDTQHRQKRVALTLDRETLVQLDANELVGVVGGTGRTYEISAISRAVTPDKEEETLSPHICLC